ncbi:MAG: substrate-binding domain-containing protein [Actinobacteria bacterium]|nr:substrate-binding domain-containing protein [Actinomycetota bacterium]
MKKGLSWIVAILITVLALTLGFSGCKTTTTETTSVATTAAETTAAVTTAAETTAVAKKLTIGVSLPSASQERWLIDDKLFVELGQKNNINVIVQHAMDDEKLQATQVENLLTQGIDALIITPVNIDAVKTIVDAAKAEGIPVVAYGRVAMNVDIDFFVARSNYSVGYEAAKLAVQLYPKGNYVIISGDEGDNVAHEKTQGNLDYLKPFVDDGSIKIVAQQYTKSWATEVALKTAENALTANNNNIVAFLCNNDSTALGALQAAEAQGLAGKVYISGEDVEIPVAQAIVEGKITASFFTPLTTWTETTFNVILDLINGKTPESDSTFNNGFKDVPQIQIKAIPITKDNMYEQIVKIGYHKIEEVYANIPKDQWPTG